MPYTLDKPVTEYSISQLLALYNDISRHNGTPTRNSTFRNKETAIKAVNGVLTQANTSVSSDEAEPILPEGKVLLVTPGLARLRSSPLADQLRASVLADQEAAAEVASDRPVTQPVAEVQDTTVANPPVAKRGRTPSLTGNEVITVLVDNPKRPGSMGHARYALYRPGMTINEYGAAVRGYAKAIRDVQWDLKRGFIKLS